MYNILITSGELNKVRERLKYSSHLWVHNGVIKKNHILPKPIKALIKFVKASERGYQFI